MLFVSFLFALGIQCERVFWWNMGFMKQQATDQQGKITDGSEFLKKVKIFQNTMALIIHHVIAAGSCSLFHIINATFHRLL